MDTGDAIFGLNGPWNKQLTVQLHNGPEHVETLVVMLRDGTPCLSMIRDLTLPGLTLFEDSGRRPEAAHEGDWGGIRGAFKALAASRWGVTTDAAAIKDAVEANLHLTQASSAKSYASNLRSRAVAWIKTSDLMWPSEMSIVQDFTPEQATAFFNLVYWSGQFPTAKTLNTKHRAFLDKHKLKIKVKSEPPYVTRLVVELPPEQYIAPPKLEIVHDARLPRLTLLHDWAQGGPVWLKVKIDLMALAAAMWGRTEKAAYVGTCVESNLGLGKKTGPVVYAAKLSSSADKWLTNGHQNFSIEMVRHFTPEQAAAFYNLVHWSGRAPPTYLPPFNDSAT